MIFFFNLRDRVITESIHESMFRGDVNNCAAVVCAWFSCV